MAASEQILRFSHGFWGFSDFQCFCFPFFYHNILIRSLLQLLVFYKRLLQITDQFAYHLTPNQQLPMTEDFLNYVRNCSKDSKSSISQFLAQLIHNDPSQIATQQSQSENHHYAKLQQIFTKISGKFSIQRSREISKDQRSKRMLTNHQYNYGQITFKTIYKIMKKLKDYKKLIDKEIFYDLGSGSGKVIFGAGLCFPFAKCKGIQFLESLYQESINMKNKILAQKDQIQEAVNQCTQRFEEYNLPAIEISNSDFKTEDWSDATVVYVSSTCYSRQVMHEISQMSQNLGKGTILITLTKSLENSHWKVIDKFEGETSWGACTIYLHRKQMDSLKIVKNVVQNLDE